MTGISRYAAVETAIITVPDHGGKTRDVRYQRRRELPDPATMVPMAQHQVLAEDRLDLVAALYYGDPTAFWRIAEANAALDPDEMIGPDAAGTTVVIPVPGA